MDWLNVPVWVPSTRIWCRTDSRTRQSAPPGSRVGSEDLVAFWKYLRRGREEVTKLPLSVQYIVHVEKVCDRLGPREMRRMIRTYHPGTIYQVHPLRLVAHLSNFKFEQCGDGNGIVGFVAGRGVLWTHSSYTVSGPMIGATMGGKSEEKKWVRQKEQL